MIGYYWMMVQKFEFPITSWASKMAASNLPFGFFRSRSLWLFVVAAELRSEQHQVGEAGAWGSSHGGLGGDEAYPLSVDLWNINEQKTMLFMGKFFDYFYGH